MKPQCLEHFGPVGTNGIQDRELLEMAARAASVPIATRNDGAALWVEAYGGVRVWNPLTDDGDALRLATCLRLEVRPHWMFSEVESGIGVYAEDCEDTNDSRNAATRRAIVRAAAAIGRQMGADAAKGE